DLQYAMMNDSTAKLFGFESSQISFNRITDHDLHCDAASLATHFQGDDLYVLTTGKDLTSLCFCQYENQEWRLLFGRKSLLLDSNNEKKGVYGRFIDVTTCPIFKMILGVCTKEQLQVTYIVKDSFDDYHLTARESEIMFYLLRGKSAKEIANLINLSVRTVETHLERIKSKMHCHSKSQLIEKAWSLGLQAYLPSILLNRSTENFVHTEEAIK
ncbi:MAG: helix-turn-helix transcriptional regulator, partial [Pseudomonadota bacterium]|nr:helix-turn-helix transcriptional regulator [Pseudomonadota bacterium]